VTDPELHALARVLARLYESGATATMQGCAAMVTVDFWEALKAEGIAPDALVYWRAMQDARDAERAKWDALLRERRTHGTAI